MSTATRGPGPDVTFQPSARFYGIINAGISIACTVVLAVGLGDLAGRRATLGTWLFIGTIAVRGLSTLALKYWAEHVASSLRSAWRDSLVAHLAVPTPERDRGRGELAVAIEQASQNPMLTMLETSALAALGALVVLFWAGGWLTLLITVALLLCAVPLYRRAGRRSEELTLDYQRRRAVLERRQLELLHHTTELRALGAVEYGANEIAAISDSEHDIAIRAIRVALESSLVTEFLSGVSIGLVAMVVGFALLGGRITLAHALIAVLVTGEMFNHVRRFGVEFHRREDSQRSLEVLRATAMTPSRSTQHLLEATDLVTVASDQRVSLTLDAGQSLLVTGASGAGKTTLLDTLLGWREPRSGDVARAATRVGHVSVESALVSGSLRDNLVLGCHISDAAVHAQLAALGLQNARFNDLESMLLSDGRGISTGEKVRLVLARALLADCELLVIDDVAGALDDGARRSVREVLDQHPLVTIVEATVDTPLLANIDFRIEIAT